LKPTAERKKYDTKNQVYFKIENTRFFARIFSFFKKNEFKVYKIIDFFHAEAYN